MSLLKKLLVIPAIALGMNFIAPPKANALIIVTIGSAGYYRIYGLDIFLCVIFPPYCIFNESADVRPVSEADLLDNGYDLQEAAAIVKSQNEFLDILARDGKAVHLQPDETAETLERSMREIHPGVSQAYIDLLKDYFDLK